MLTYAAIDQMSWLSIPGDMSFWERFQGLGKEIHVENDNLFALKMIYGQLEMVCSTWVLLSPKTTKQASQKIRFITPEEMPFAQETQAKM